MFFQNPSPFLKMESLFVFQNPFWKPSFSIFQKPFFLSPQKKKPLNNIRDPLLYQSETSSSPSLSLISINGSWSFQSDRMILGPWSPSANQLALLETNSSPLFLSPLPSCPHSSLSCSVTILSSSPSSHLLFLPFPSFDFFFRSMALTRYSPSNASPFPDLSQPIPRLLFLFLQTVFKRFWIVLSPPFSLRPNKQTFLFLLFS